MDAEGAGGGGCGFRRRGVGGGGRGVKGGLSLLAEGNEVGDLARFPRVFEKKRFLITFFFFRIIYFKYFSKKKKLFVMRARRPQSIQSILKSCPDTRSYTYTDKHTG